MHYGQYEARAPRHVCILGTKSDSAHLTAGFSINRTGDAQSPAPPRSAEKSPPPPWDEGANCGGSFFRAKEKKQTPPRTWGNTLKRGTFGSGSVSHPFWPLFRKPLKKRFSSSFELRTKKRLWLPRPFRHGFLGGKAGARFPKKNPLSFSFTQKTKKKKRLRDFVFPFRMGVDRPGVGF